MISPAITKRVWHNRKIKKKSTTRSNYFKQAPKQHWKSIIAPPFSWPLHPVIIITIPSNASPASLSFHFPLVQIHCHHITFRSIYPYPFGLARASALTHLFFPLYSLNNTMLVHNLDANFQQNRKPSPNNTRWKERFVWIPSAWAIHTCCPNGTELSLGSQYSLQRELKTELQQRVKISLKHFHFRWNVCCIRGSNNTDMIHSRNTHTRAEHHR